jgi:pimeloyl-ACP methyl ester carboxylesterase
MRWLKRLVLAVAVLCAAAAGVLAVGSLTSLDWERAHTSRVAELPLGTPSHSDGEVRIAAGEYSFRARVAGLANPGPGLILLHGFPETSTMWMPVIEAAAAAGYRVVAFDQRGYSPGARPGAISDYATPELVADVLAVADAMGFERFHLVGHDWGAVVGWWTVMQYPDRIRSWTALSIPHVGVFLAAMRDEIPTYINMLRIPWLPEALFTFNGLAAMTQSYDRMPEAQGQDYFAVFSEPGALTAAINYYRALPESIRAASDVPTQIDRPVLFIWGNQDYWGSRPERTQQYELILGPYEEIELDAGHSLIEEEPKIVVEAILKHLAGVDASESH